MPAPGAAELLNFVGFITGAVLYAMLLALVLRAPARESPAAVVDRLPLATAVLGLVWNLGGLLAYLLPRLGMTAASVGLSALSFPALGLLAAVVVHSVARTLPRAVLITAAAYACAIVASVLHIRTVLTGDPASSALAFNILTVCFSVIIVILGVLTRRQSNGPRAVWMLALALFAISATHLGRFHGDDSPWLVELAGHHAAIPLAFAILYQDYRFALVDLFLKQALTLLALVSLAFGSYSLVSTLAGESSLAVGALLALWIGTTLLYPWLRRQIVRFVDTVLLGREDYAVLRLAIAQDLASRDTIEGVLDRACECLADALSARRVQWHEGPQASGGRDPALRVGVPTAEQPTYEIRVSDLAAGRRLLSDDESLAEAVGALAGRRIDSVRLSNERYERRLREEEMQKLAAEAELKALRAQINPHFLFNALTTVGYLIGSSPTRALDTLMRLTSLLRAVLRPDGEFTTLGREVELVEHYLDIERARFEERLRVRIDVPAELRPIRLPSLLLQPLVENAVKHGVAPSVRGGMCVYRRRSSRGPAIEGGSKSACGIPVRRSNPARVPAASGWRTSSGVLPGIMTVRATLQLRERLTARPLLASSCPSSNTANMVTSVNKTLRVLLADDERPARRFLGNLLKECEGVEVVAEATNGREALDLIEAHKPDLALLDLQMPDLGGLAVARLLKGGAAPMVAFVTAFDEFSVEAFG